MKNKILLASVLLALFAAGRGYADDPDISVEPGRTEIIEEHPRFRQHELKTGEYPDAKKTAERVNQSDEFRRIGDMYYEKGDMEKAVAYYERAIMLDENNMRAHGSMTAAIKARDATEMAVSDRYHRAMEYLRKGMIDLAIDELVLEIKENPDNDAAKIRLKEIEKRYRWDGLPNP